MDDLKAKIEALPHWHTEHGTVIHRGDTLALIATHAAEPGPVAVEGAPERIWTRQTSGWGDLQRGQWQNSGAAGGTEYIRADLASTDNTALVEALTNIARQKKTDELATEYHVEIADFEGGYDALIDVARAALARGSVAEKGER